MRSAKMRSCSHSESLSAWSSSGSAARKLSAEINAVTYLGLPTIPPRPAINEICEEDGKICRLRTCLGIVNCLYFSRLTLSSRSCLRVKWRKGVLRFERGRQTHFPRNENQERCTIKMSGERSQNLATVRPRTPDREVPKQPGGSWGTSERRSCGKKAPALF